MIFAGMILLLFTNGSWQQDFFSWMVLLFSALDRGKPSGVFQDRLLLVGQSGCKKHGCSYGTHAADLGSTPQSDAMK